jgi:hypothetical protein
MHHIDDGMIASAARQPRRRTATVIIESTLSVLIVGVWAIGFLQYAYVAGLVQ